MMILAFFGDNAEQHEKVVEQLELKVKGFNIEHVDNNRSYLSVEQKVSRIQRLVTSRNRRDTVTVVTGITEIMEYRLLVPVGAVFCIMPGVLPPVLSRGLIPIDDSFLYVTLKASELDTEAKRRIYMAPDEAFSECYRRDLGLSRKGRLL